MKTFLWSFKYACAAFRHKYFVFVAGWNLHVPFWRLLKHDWSKFTPSELPHYGRQFFGDVKDPDAWARAWLHHQNTNDHHWEYWVTRGQRTSGHSKGPLPMPWVAVREMVADWMAAGRAYKGKWPDLENWTWLNENLPRIDLHPETRRRVLFLINFMKHRKREKGIKATDSE